jgi:hypothetical protein
MYLTNYTADKVKLAYTFAEHLRHNWRMLDDGKKDELLNEITRLLNVDFVETRIESKLDKIASNGKYNKTSRRPKLGQ